MSNSIDEGDVCRGGKSKSGMKFRAPVQHATIRPAEKARQHELLQASPWQWPDPFAQQPVLLMPNRMTEGDVAD